MLVDPQLAEARFERDVRPFRERPEAFLQSGIRIVNIAFPKLIVALAWQRRQREIQLAMDATDYDYVPVSARWISEDGTPLFSGSGNIPAGAGFHAAGYAPDMPPFLCFRGFREYHDHISHATESWAAYRGNPQYTIPALLQQLVVELNREGVGAA